MPTSELQSSPTTKPPPPPSWPNGASLWQRLLLAGRIARVRLRFIIVFAVAFVVVGKWHILRNYWDKLTHPGASSDTTEQAVSSATEYFCPMDPGVISSWSGKCGICNMALVRRKKGDMVQLPDGVVARMQLSPYRVQLAGIQTSLVSFQPLVRRITTIGRVDQLEQPTADGSTSNAIVIADVFMRDVPFLAEGQRAELRSDGASTSFCTGKLAPIESQGTSEYSVLPVRILVDKIPARAFPGMVVTVQIHVPIADLEPYRSMPRSAPPMAPDSLREVYGCAEHPDVIKTKAGKCPLGKHDLERRQLTEDQRVDWWCPMHPQIKSDTPGAECRECDGMKLLPRVVTFTPIGAVLAVPESAVIDTGAKRVVYVERSPGMFDGVEVELGPRCADGYPVISGLEAGQRVATSGSFLIDAETRLNPGVAVGYFGAGTGGKQ